MVTFTKLTAGFAAVASVASGAALKTRLAHDKVVPPCPRQGGRVPRDGPCGFAWPSLQALPPLPGGP